MTEKQKLMLFYGWLINRTTSDTPKTSGTFRWITSDRAPIGFKVTTSEAITMLFALVELKVISRVYVGGIDLHPVYFKCYVIDRYFKFEETQQNNSQNDSNT